MEVHLVCNLSLTLAFTLIKLYFFFPFLSFLISLFCALKVEIVVGIKTLRKFGVKYVVI